MELARHNDTDTSHKAAASVQSQLHTIQREVLDAFNKLGSMTDKTLNGLFSEKNYAESTVRKRRSELTALGYLKDSGVRDGRHAVWELA